jgi:perosamine synthetase
MSIRIPIYKPAFFGNEKKYVSECMDSTWISGSGKFVDRFEREFANTIGVSHAITVSNGTVALHLALLALGIKDGDEVIVPTFTYVASVNAIKYCNATPVFIESLLDTWQLDPEDFAKKITRKTKAIIVPHLYGMSCNMSRICEIAHQHHIRIIEDVAEAFGTLYHSKPCGSFGDIATFSFFGNKTITCGEGGMVVTSDVKLNDLVRRLKSQGLAKHGEYFHDIIGYNYRMTNIAAAIGLAQLEKAEFIIKKKRDLAEMYKEEFAKAKCDITFHYDNSGSIFCTYWMCSILFKSSEIREIVREKMRIAGIETRPLFYPAHLMPMYQGSKGDFKIAEHLGSCGINLPSWPELQQEDLKFIVRTIAESLHD